MGFSLHQKQFKVYQDKHRFRVLVAGRRFGKSELSKTELIRAAANHPGLIYYISPSLKMSRQNMWKPLKEAVPREWVKPNGINETLMDIQLLNGSTLGLRGADKGGDSLRGVGLTFVVFDEFQDTELAAWTDSVRPMLSTTGGRALFIGTPKTMQDALFNVHQRGEDTTNHDWKSWSYTTADSPFIPKAEIEAAKNDMDPRSFDREYFGRYSNVAGLVLYAWERKLHVKDTVKHPTLPIIIGIDLNITPCTATLMQYHPQLDELHVFDEITLNQSNTFELCEEIDRRYWRDKQRIILYPDASGASKSTKTRNNSDIDIMRQYGFVVDSPKKNPYISDRMNAANRMLKDAKGRVRLKVDPSCKEVIRCCEGLQYIEGKSEIDKTQGFDHQVDSLTYPIHRLFPINTKQVFGVNL